MNRSVRFRSIRGFSVVELMVAVAISVFLLIGLFTILQSTRKGSDNERVMTQLQDNERVAMVLLGNVIESAGYYSDALTQDLTTQLPVSANFAQAGQAVVGGNDANGDNVTLRYQAKAADGVLNCQGTTVGTGRYENKFSIVPTGDTLAGLAENELVCSINGGAAVPLVRGIQTLAITYGVGSAAPSPNQLGPVDAYLTSAQMTALYWTNVYTIKVNLTFINPLYGQPGQTSKTISFSRIFSLKSRTGVNSATIT